MTRKEKARVGKMITTSECEKCIHSIIDDSDKARLYVYCKVRDKKYMYGQRIPCENMKSKR